MGAVVGRTAARAAARRRALGRAAAAGFTLVELMVVVVLISILALLATPAMRTSRDDRLAFDYARRIEQMIQRTHTRAAGRGAAHLFVASPSGANRGRFLLFEALDGELPANGGPNPRSSCKQPLIIGGAPQNQWLDVSAWAPGAVSSTARLIEGLELDAPGANVDADIRTAFTAYGAAAATVVMCVSPGQATWVGVGANPAAAIADMQARVLPFSSSFDISVTRNRAGVPIGLTRRVITTGTAGPRIFSQ